MKFKRISDNYKKGARYMYDVECECGSIKHVRATVDTKDILTCKRCCLTERNKTTLAGCKSVGIISKSFYGYFRGGANRRGVEYDVSMEYLDEIAKEQQYKCALSGLDIVFPQRSKRGGNHTKDPNNASLDRIDSSLPYQEGNVQWVHKSVNIMKNGFSQDEFVWFCHKIVSCHDNPELSSLKGNRK